MKVLILFFLGFLLFGCASSSQQKSQHQILLEEFCVEQGGVFGTELIGRDNPSEPFETWGVMCEIIEGGLLYKECFCLKENCDLGEFSVCE